MRHWFLSFNSQDLALMQGLEAALRRKDPEANIYFAPRAMRAGGFYLPELVKAVNEATAFVLLVGKNGLGPWQVIEYYEALARRVKAHAQQAKAPDQGGEPHELPVVLVLLEGEPAPGLPFLTQLHWIVTSDPASEQSIARLLDAAQGAGSTPGQLWRHTAPYRGLAAMTEADADFFFGRVDKTVEVINTLEAGPDKLPVLLGNSGVGKSSLAQAGVLSCLRRQSWPETANAGAWPAVFRDSRGWCFLTVRPGVEPIKALVEAFLATWRFDAGDPARIKQRNEWVELLLDQNRKTNLPDLLDETERRHQELNQSKPPSFFLYIDQGEELYVRAEERQRRRFSEVLAHALGDPRLRAMLSMRADFFGPQQNGRHERMHLTLKKEATRPPGFNSLQQQERFDVFVREFNTERPHEALDMKCPAELYTASARVYAGLPELTYPFHDRDVIVTACGRLCLLRKRINVSTVLAGQKLGIKEVDEGDLPRAAVRVEVTALEAGKLRVAAAGEQRRLYQLPKILPARINKSSGFLGVEIAHYGGIWLASFMHYDLGYFDLEQKTLQPLDNPFGTRLSPMS